MTEWRRRCLQQIFPPWGGKALAVLIMVSTFGCINSLVLAGPRAYYAMARDKLFFPAAGQLNRARVPGVVSGYTGYLGGDTGVAHHLLRRRAMAIFTAIYSTTSSRRRCCSTSSPLPPSSCCDINGPTLNGCIVRRAIRWFLRFTFWAPARWCSAFSSSGRHYLAGIGVRHRRATGVLADPPRRLQQGQPPSSVSGTLARMRPHRGPFLPGAAACENENPVRESYVLILLQGEIELWRLGVKDMLPRGLAANSP